MVSVPKLFQVGQGAWSPALPLRKMQKRPLLLSRVSKGTVEDPQAQLQASCTAQANRCRSHVQQMEQGPEKGAHAPSRTPPS